MSMTLEQIAAEALCLSPEARAILADRLVASLDEVTVGRLDELWAAEARRRHEEVRSGLVAAIPGEEAAVRVRQASGG